MKTVTTLLLGILCLAKGGCWDSTVEGYAGGSVIIKCKYDKNYKDQSKYFCKDGGKMAVDKYGCNTQIISSQEGWHREGRFSVHDDKDESFLSVIMRDLAMEDEGKYWCAVDINMWPDEYTEIDLNVKEAEPEINIIYKVSGYIGHDISIKCKYEMSQKDNGKYLYKSTDEERDCRMRAHKKDEWERRFSLYDNTTGGFLMVSISELTQQDAGIYWCVVEEPFVTSKVWEEKFKAIHLDVLSGKPPTIEVTGYERGAVMMTFSFSHSNKDNKKYFCKVNSTGPGCTDKITTDVNDKWKTAGRFSLFYNSSGKFSLVKIRELTKEDNGTYLCAVDTPFRPNRQVTVDEHTDVHLEVMEDISFRENYKQIQAITGEQLNITCKYPDQHRDNPKFLCKENDNRECRYPFHSHDSRGKRDSDVYSLHDRKEDGLLVVSFRNVTTYESGQYWCGVEVNWESGGYKAFITKITLIVTAPTSPSNSPPRPPTKTSSSTTTSTSTTTTSPSLTLFRPAYQNQGSPVVLPVLVVIMVVATGIIIFVCFRRRKGRGKDPASNRTNTEGNNSMRAPADCEYEEIKDTGISASGSDTVHAEAQLPTNPCSDPTYSTVQLSISPGDDITDPQGLNYASVNFQKNPSTNDNSVTVNKEELFSDYATVKSSSHI